MKRVQYAGEEERKFMNWGPATGRHRTFVTPWTAVCQASLFIINSWSLLKFMSIELVMASNHLILCHPLLLPPLIFPSIRVFSNESALRIRWPTIGASTSVLPMNILDLFPLGLTDLISLLSKGVSTVFSSTTVQSINFLALSLLYGPTLTPIHASGKTIALTIQTFVSKVTPFLLICCLGY